MGLPGDKIETNVTTLAATTTAGGIYLSETDGLTLNSATAAGSGADVDISAGGNILLGAIAALGDDVTLTSTGGYIADNNGNSVNVTAKTLTIEAPNGIGIGAGQVNSALCTASTLLPGASQTSYVFADPVYLTPSAQRQFGTYAYDRLRARW